MKKSILFLVFLTCSWLARAQADSLQQYTGKYRFPDGSPVTEIGVVLENGVLSATSVMGNSELRATGDKDVYEIVAYAGTATFRRNEEGKITHLRVQVQDVDMEGVKVEGEISTFLFNKVFNSVYHTHFSGHICNQSVRDAVPPFSRISK